MTKFGVDKAIEVNEIPGVTEVQSKLTVNSAHSEVNIARRLARNQLGAGPFHSLQRAHQPLHRQQTEQQIP